MPAASNNGTVQKILAALVLTALLAGAGAIIAQEGIKRNVNENTKKVDSTAYVQIVLRERMARVETKVEAVQKAVDDNGEKLDKILNKLP